MTLDKLDGDGDDEEVRRFRNSSGGAELGVDVRGLLVLVLGVAEVEEVEVDALVCSAEVEVVHGVAAISEASPKIAGFQRKKNGGELEASRARRSGRRGSRRTGGRSLGLTGDGGTP